MSCPTCGGGYGVHDDYTHSWGAYAPSMGKVSDECVTHDNQHNGEIEMTDGIIVDAEELISVIDDLHSLAYELNAEQAYRLVRVLGFDTTGDEDAIVSGAELRSRLRELFR